METITESKISLDNNESLISKGIYKELDGSYTWLTATRSGNCKKLSTAKSKVNF